MDNEYIDSNRGFGMVQIERVSFSATGSQVTDAFVGAVALSPDGSLVVYLSSSRSLAAQTGAPTPGFADNPGYYYIYNRNTQTLVRIPLENAFPANDSDPIPNFFSSNYSVALDNHEVAVSYGSLAYLWNIDTQTGHAVTVPNSTDFGTQAYVGGGPSTIFSSVHIIDVGSGTTNQNYNEFTATQTSSGLTSKIDIPQIPYGSSTSGTTTISYVETDFVLAASRDNNLVVVGAELDRTTTTPDGVSSVGVSMDLLVINRATGAVDRITNNNANAFAQGAAAPMLSSYDIPTPSISDDGRYVAYQVPVSLPGSNTTFGSEKVVVFDRTNRTTEIDSISSAGMQANANSVHPTISGDGRYVAFVSDASNLGFGGTSGYYQLYVHDRSTGSTALVNTPLDSSQSYVTVAAPSLSDNGQIIAFNSAAGDLVAGDTNKASDEFVAVNPLFVPTAIAVGGTLDLSTVSYLATDRTIFTATAIGGTLQIVDPTHGNAVVTTLTLGGSYAGGLFSLARDGGTGTTLGFAAAPMLDLSPGSVETTTFNITGQGYTGTVYTTDAQGQLVSARYTGVKGQAYQGFETDYRTGSVTGTQFFYLGITGQNYTTETLRVNAAGQQTAVQFGGVSGQPYSCYQYIYDGGLFTGSEFTYTAVPSGATYSSYKTDYDFASAYQGAKFFYTNLTGQTYTGEEIDTTPTGAASRVLLTGYTGQPYKSLELDYTSGTYSAYKIFETGVTGQSYTGLEEDVTAAGQVTKVVYTGLKSTPYTTLEQDYTGGALSSSIFTFNAPAGQSYSSYSVTQNAAGTQISETINITNGSHTILGSAPNLIFESIGNDTITGGGAGETFAFHNVFGHDTLTDFYQHAIGAGHDTLDLSTADFTSFATLSSAAQNVSGGVMFTGKSGSSITLSGSRQDHAGGARRGLQVPRVRLVSCLAEARPEISAAAGILAGPRL